jgi:hypothetical protein
MKHVLYTIPKLCEKPQMLHLTLDRIGDSAECKHRSPDP